MSGYRPATATADPDIGYSGAGHPSAGYAGPGPASAGSLGTGYAGTGYAGTGYAGTGQVDWNRTGDGGTSFVPGHARVTDAPATAIPAPIPVPATAVPATGAAWPVTAVPRGDWAATSMPVQDDWSDWPTPGAQVYWPPPGALPPGGLGSGPEPPPKRKMLRGFALTAALLIIAPLTGIAILVAILQASPLPQASRSVAGSAPPVAATPAQPVPTGSAPTSLDPAAVAAAVEPAVVDVNATLGFRNAQAAGTGVILDGSGVVLTNNHVIAGATAISVTEVANGRTRQANVVGYDRSHDIAILQLVGAGNLRAIALGDSSAVAIGDPVVAIGNAGGTGGKPTTVTGSVTALNRSITATDADGSAAERLTGLIEVNADIRPGDSGGPLLDQAGRLIGINTATSVGTGGEAASRQGFAIPVNTAIAIARQIGSGQESATIHIGQTALLGVQTAQNGGQNGNGQNGNGQNGNGQNGNGNGNGRNGDQQRTGAPVTAVVNGSPAQRAGLSPGDLIISFDGRTVDSPTALTDLVDARHPGDRVRLQWIDAGGRGRAATVELAVGPAG